MDLKSLRTFQMVVNRGSFHRAAEELNYAQSTVTMQIKKLESDLGVQLIERGKNFRLTEAGKLFHEQGLHIVKNIEQLQTSLSDLKLGEAGNIRLGVTEPTASYRLPDILKRFLSRYPKIRVSVDIANTPTLSQALLKDDLDLALCSPPDLGSGLNFEALFTEEFAVLMSDRHPLSRKRMIKPNDIRGHRLLITSATCPYRRKLETVLQKTAGSTPLDTMEIGSVTALKCYVESGLGIALIPKIVLNPIPAGTTIRMMNDNAINITSGLLFKESKYPLNQASSKLYQFLQQELG